jgi:exonuclease III
MLENFLYIHEIDVICLQEITSTTVTKILNYTAHVNIGTEGRGTAILHKDCYTLTVIEKLPTGSGIIGTFNDLKILNVYAPSGSERKRERQEFFNTEVPRLLIHPHNTLIIAGDFNCVIHPSDTTGSPNMSRALKHLIARIDLQDAWVRGNNKPVFTHYTAKGAARLDRIYVTRPLMKAKKNAVIHATAFTDHFSIILHIERPPTVTPRGHGYWKLNNTLLQDKGTEACFKSEWDGWSRVMNRYPTTVHWWVQNVKTRIGKLFRRIGSERKTKHKHMENFYYAAIYDLISEERDTRMKMIALQHLKAKIIRLKDNYYKSMMLVRKTIMGMNSLPYSIS